MYSGFFDTEVSTERQLADVFAQRQESITSTDPDPGTFVRKDTLTAKGDLFAATAGSVIGRQAVGANGTILEADSTQSAGLKWISAFTYVTLTDGATITWTVASVANNATVTLGGNRTLAFSGLANGMTGTLIVKQDGTGGRTLTLPAGSKVINGGAGAIALSAAANAIDILTWTYDGTNTFWTFGKNYT